MAKVNLDVAQRLDITCRKGDSFELKIDFGISMSSDPNAWNMHVLDSDESSGSSLINFMFTVEANDDNVPNSVLIIEATYTEMAGISSGTYVYDLELGLNNKKVTHLYGLFVVNEDVTVV